MVFPELFRSIFAGNSCKDLFAAWMVVLEFGEIIDIFIYDNEEIIGLIVRCNITLAERLRHFSICVGPYGMICCCKSYDVDILILNSNKNKKVSGEE